MAWAKTNTNGYGVWTETITLPAAGNSTAKNSSTIDFVPPGSDFTVMANLAAVNTASDGDVDVQVSHNGSTWSTIKADLIATFDTAVKSALYDVSANGAAPYYRLQITNDGNQNSESFQVAVLVP